MPRWHHGVLCYGVFDRVLLTGVGTGCVCAPYETIARIVYASSLLLVVLSVANGADWYRAVPLGKEAQSYHVAACCALVQHVVR